jgi:transcriptional regulator with XRE-family HTH domain
MDVNTRIAQRLRELRSERGYSLETLAERSGVSRSNISLIERGQSSPTATVLDKLAIGLSVALASFFEDSATTGFPPEPVLRLGDQPMWQDPASGYVRRRLSPPAQSPLQMVEVLFPPGQRLALDSAVHDADIYQQVWLLDGTMELSLGETKWRLEKGDCLAMQLSQPIMFYNPGQKFARYLVALSSASRMAHLSKPSHLLPEKGV